MLARVCWLWLQLASNFGALRGIDSGLSNALLHLTMEKVATYIMGVIYSCVSLSVSSLFRGGRHYIQDYFTTKYIIYIFHLLIENLYAS